MDEHKSTDKLTFPSERDIKGVSGFFMGLLQHAPTPIYVKSTDKHFLLVNRAWEEVFNLAQEAVVGRHVAELFPPEIARQFTVTDEQVIKTGGPLTFEQCLDLPKVGRRYYHTVKFPLRTATGQIKAVGGISIDITPRKRTEQAVRDSEERYRLLFERNLAGVWRARPDGVIVDCNEAFARIAGCEAAADLLDRPLAELYAQPNDWKTFADRLQQRRSLTNYESILVRPDGAEVHILTNASLSAGPEGPQIQGTVVDISERWQARQELIAERHLLRTLMDHVPDHIYFKDGQSRFTRVNQAQARHMGLADPLQAVGKTDHDFFTSEHADQARRDELEVMRTGQPLLAKEEKETWPDGRELWMASSKLPLRDADGKVVGTFGISRDITAHKHALEALRVSEERHRLISKLTSDYVYSIRFNSPPPKAGAADAEFAAYKDYTTEWVTESFKRVTGYTIEEVAARGGWPTLLHPDDALTGLAFSRQFLSGQRGEAEYRIITKSGEVRWLRDYCQPFWDEKHQCVLRLVGGVQDITERKRAEEALREGEALYRVLFENAPVGLGIADANGCLIAFNDAMLKPGGYAREDLVGPLANVGALYWDPAERAQVLALAAQHGSIHRQEVRFKRKDGTPYATLLDLTNVSLQGKPCRLAMVEDITERKQLEEQLRQSQKMEAIGQLAGGIAHDFNNLLTAILGNVSLLLGAVPDHEPNRDLLRDIERAATRATELTSQLLGFSRQTILRLEPANLNNVLRETVAILRWTIDPRITVTVQTAEDLSAVQADASQLNQVLMNLCLNARDAMPEGGQLILETENVLLASEQARRHLDARAGDFVRLRVRDTGSGIPADVRPRIFDPFFTTKGPGKGTGLGLAMVFGIVKQHQGWIECHSEVGHGTTFDIYLPRCDADLKPQETPAASSAPGGGSETVLLVDDEAIIRNLGRTILQRYGYHVLLAEDGQDALEIFQRRQGQIDLVILDLTMPRLSGRDTLREMLKLDPAVRVVFSSGYSSEQLDADRDGVVGFVNKPYRPQDLAQTVRQVLDQAKKG